MRLWPWTSKETSAIAAAPQAAPETKTPPTEPELVISAGRKSARLYPADSINPQSYNRILKQADLGQVDEYMELLDTVADDAHAGSVLRTMKLAVAGAPYHVDPGEDSDPGREIAIAGEAFLRRIPNLTQLKVDLLDAEYKGFACVDPRWADIGGKHPWQVTGFQPIEQRFFRFEDDRPLIETMRAPSGEPVPDGVLFHAVRDKAGSILRGGIGRPMAKLFVYKGFAVLDTASFLERFGHPFVHAELPAGMKESTPELERVKSAIRKMMVDQVAIVSPGVQIKMLESLSKAGTVRDTFLVWISWCEAGMSKAALGQTLTTDAGPGGLGHGAEAKQQGEVRQDLKESVAVRLDETINSQLLRLWTFYHYGAGAPVPRMCTDVAAPVDEKAKAETQKVRAETFGVLKRELKLTLSRKQVRQEFDALEPDPKDPGDAIEGDAAPPAPPLEASLRHRAGACPDCGASFTLAAAEKKKRSMDSVT